MSAISMELLRAWVASPAKDITGTARDAALLLLGLRLILFPSTFNRILVSAGFEEGSGAGMKWKSKPHSSDQALNLQQVRLLNFRSG